MGLFRDTFVTIKMDKTSVNLDPLKDSIDGIKTTIEESVDKIIESQKDDFVEIGDERVRRSTIKSFSKIKNEAFSVLLESGRIEFQGATSLETRIVYNMLAKLFGLPLDGDICFCGKTIEKIKLNPRWENYRNLEKLCDDCRLEEMVKEGLYGLVTDYSLLNQSIKFIDGTTKELDSFLPEEHLRSIVRNSRLGGNFVNTRST